MKKVFYCFLFAVSVLLISCTSDKQSSQTPINEIPEFGHVKKSKEQLEADQEFLDYFKGNEEKGYIDCIENGWYYLEAGDPHTAMKRFNQAWLLDSSRFEVYWSFGAAEYVLGNTESAKKYYKKAIKLCEDAEIREYLEQDYSQLK